MNSFSANIISSQISSILAEFRPRMTAGLHRPFFSMAAINRFVPDA